MPTNVITGINGFYPVSIYTITNDVWTPSGSTNHLQSYEKYRHRSWTRTLNWKSLLESRGWLATTAYSDTVVHEKPIFAESYKFTLKSDPRNGVGFKSYQVVGMTEGMIALPSFTGNPVWNDLLLDAKNACLTKARNRRIDLSVAVGEGKTTFDMLHDTVKQLGSAYGHFRKGRFKKAAKSLGISPLPKSLANNWLAYQYGWKPLVSDAVGLVETHRDQMRSTQKQRYRIVAQKTYVGTGKRTLSNFCVTNNHALSFDTTTYVARAGLLLEVSSTIDKFKASVGLSAGDVLSTAWELVPFSFVFDWFVDVGTWLGNLNALSGLTVLDGWTTGVITRACNFMPSAGPGSLYNTNVPDRFAWKRAFTRNPWNPGVMTWPRVSSVTDLSATRLISAAALFAQNFRGDPPIGKFRPKSSD